MAIENETREIFMSLPTWNARDALRMLLEIDPDSIRLDDDFDGSEIEVEARALIGWLYRYGILPRAIREPYDAAPELISEYLDAIGDVRRTPAEWIAAAVANPGAPVEWLESLQSVSGAPKRGRPMLQQAHQEQEILRVINELGYAATNLPKDQRGKNGVKADVRERLNFSVKVFDKAWERLSADGRIRKQT